ncbi:AMP-binding protein [Nocardia sp. NPDC051787]|uniref:AMP-binding protein n=1 Tax=Nocardia sp. NPDC051787 TaxID=3155415 RepID=UPI0034469876
MPLAQRGLPESTYALLVRAAHSWPERTAVTVLPEAARWREPLQRSFAQLLAHVHRYANLLHELGVRRDDAVALIAPNCAELIAATLAAQLAGIAAPINGGLSRRHIAELRQPTGARILITAGPELAEPVWDSARALAADGLLNAVLVLRPTAANSLLDDDAVLIIRGGHNIDPAIIEDALLAHPQVTAAGAVGRPDIHAGEVPVAYVTLGPGADITEPDLLEWASRHVPECAAAPKMVTILDALPVTDVGKPHKLGLRADATRRELLDGLADVAGVHGIVATVEDGTIVATVELDDAGDENAVAAVLVRYAIEWKVEVP